MKAKVPHILVLAISAEQNTVQNNVLYKQNEAKNQRQ